MSFSAAVAKAREASPGVSKVEELIKTIA